jgi:hypothetical protein
MYRAINSNYFPKLFVFHVDLVQTRLDSQIAKVHLGGNPWLPTVKATLKNGGVPRLFQSMREASWQKTIQEELQKSK